MVINGRGWSGHWLYAADEMGHRMMTNSEGRGEMIYYAWCERCGAGMSIDMVTLNASGSALSSGCKHV